MNKLFRIIVILVAASMLLTACDLPVKDCVTTDSGTKVCFSGNVSVSQPTNVAGTAEVAATPGAMVETTETPAAQPTVSTTSPTQVKYDCRSDGHCLTGAFLTGRNYTDRVPFTAGTVLGSFLKDGAWSIHFESDVDQLATYGSFNVQAFGSYVDFHTGDNIAAFKATSNGVAIRWASNEDRTLACKDWNVLQSQYHPNYTLDPCP